MALSSYEYNKRSEAKRGISTRGYKLHKSTVSLIKKVAEHQGISQGTAIEQAINLLAEKYNIEADSPD